MQMVFFVAPPVVLFAGFMKLSRRSAMVFLLIMGPYLLAGTLALVRGITLIESNTYKAAPSYALCLFPMIAVAPFIDRNHRKNIILTIATAILLHGVFGLVQWFAFARGSFPLADWFINNSFLVSDNDLLGRPMGYFPEPSAMAAVLGPFLMMLLILLVDRRKVKILSSLEKSYVNIAAGFGLILLALSKSGFILPFAVALVGVVFIGLPAWGGQGIIQKISRYLVFVVVIGGSGLWTWTLVQDRFDTEFNTSGSWTGRLDSISQAVELWTSDWSLFFMGVGSNQAHLHMEQMGTYQTFGGMTRFGAVYSVLFTFILETGLMGAFGFIGVIWIALRAIRRSDFAAGGLAVLFCWLVAVTVTTSYFVFPGLWLCLGLLILWDRLFPVEKLVVSQEKPAGEVFLPVRGTQPGVVGLNRG